MYNRKTVFYNLIINYYIILINIQLYKLLKYRIKKNNF